MKPEIAVPPQRDLARYVQWYDAAMPEAFCAQMIRGFNDVVPLQAPNGRGHRPGLEESAWTEEMCRVIATRSEIAALRAKLAGYRSAKSCQDSRLRSIEVRLNIQPPA